MTPSCRPRHRGRLGALVAVCAIWIAMIRSLWTTTTAPERTVVVFSNQNNASAPSLRLGELPGYTGWARPAQTVAGRIRLVSISSTTENAALHWQATLEGGLEGGGAQFYVRAYGPAVVTGTVMDYTNGTYVVSLPPLVDAGRYFVEVVLTYSFLPPAAVAAAMNDHFYYEGHLLPDFPQVIEHFADTTTSVANVKLPICQAHQLLDETSTEPTRLPTALTRGRWVVTERIPWDKPPVSSEGNNILRQYMLGPQSLGVTMEYLWHSCRVPTLEQFADELWPACRDQATGQDRLVRIIFIGDSNMRLQKELWDRMMVPSAWPSSVFIKIVNGLVANKQALNFELQQLHNSTDHHRTDYFVLLNSGLHDIMQLCATTKNKQGRPPVNNNKNHTCLNTYQAELAELVDTIHHVIRPRRLVWQSTTAGWMKWGVYAANFPGDALQAWPQTPEMCRDWNQAAAAVMPNVSVLDAYWLSLARPDHRDARERNALGKRLVHAGPQVYGALMRQWSLILQQELCPELYSNKAT
jgi:hypothetical protein